MSDNTTDTTHTIPSSSNVPTADLAQKMALLEAENAALRAAITPSAPVTTIDAPRTKHLLISQEMVNLIPSLSGRHFFTAPDNPEDDDVCNEDIRFPKNVEQQYTAPTWDVPWPADKAGAHYQFEKSLVKILERQAHTTRPIDEFAVEYLSTVRDEDARKAFAEFIHVIRSQMALNARQIQEVRQDNYLRAKGLTPPPEKGKGDTITQDAINAKIKAAVDYAKAMPKKSDRGQPRGGRGGYGRGNRNWGNGGFQFGQQQRPQYQQQYQQQFQQYPQQHPGAYSQQVPYQQQPFAYQNQGYSDSGFFGQQPPQGFHRGRGRGNRGRGQTSQ